MEWGERGTTKYKSRYGRRLLIDGRVMASREDHVFLFVSKCFPILLLLLLVDPFGYASVQEPDLSRDAKPDLSKDQIHKKSFRFRCNEDKTPKKAPF
jgi:hypothetical protein